MLLLYSLYTVANFTCKMANNVKRSLKHSIRGRCPPPPPSPRNRLPHRLKLAEPYPFLATVKKMVSMLACAWTLV